MTFTPSMWVKFTAGFLLNQLLGSLNRTLFACVNVVMKKEIDVFSVLHGKTTSCGCYRKEKTSSLGKGNLRPAELIGETFTNSKGFEYKVVDKVYQALIKYEVEITD